MGAFGGTGYASKSWHFCDLNHDGRVGWPDFAVFAAQWLDTGCSAPTWCTGADMNHDGSVNWGDFAPFAANWLWGTPDYWGP